MTAIEGYAIAALAVALFYLWSFSLALSIRLQVARERPITWSVITGLLFGPMAALVAIVGYRRRNPRNSSSPIIVSITSVAAGLLCLTGCAFTGFIIGKHALGMSGESLQTSVTVGIMVGSLMSGVVMAYCGQRIAVIESLLVLAFFSWIPVLLGKNILELFTYGTATAYFGAVLASIALVSALLLTLGGAIGFLFCGEGRISHAFYFEKFIGMRFLMAKRTSHVVSLITLISIFAVVIGCAGMVVVMSVMDGFSSDLRKKILGTNAHLVVMKYGDSFREYRSVIKKTETLPGVIGASPYILNEVMISSDANISGAVIKGIEVATVDRVNIISANMIEGSLTFLDDPKKIPQRKVGKKRSELDSIEELFSQSADKSDRGVLPGIVIGVEMAKFLRLTVGSPLTVVSPIGEVGPTGPIPKAKAFRVAGIFFSGMYEYDSKFVYISLLEADQFFASEGSVSGVEFKVSDLDHTLAVAAALKKELGGYPYYTRDWMQMNRNLFSALKLEKIAMFIILVALIFMASLLILVALVMVVMEKGKEIAILKSIGVTDLSIMKIFVTYGVTIGSAGALLGVALGLLFCWLISLFGIGLDPEVYYISELPVKVDIIDVTAVGVAAIIISFLATIPPSLFAAKLKPVEGLRYD